MKLVTIPIFLERHFDPACAPSEFTVRRLLRESKLPGRKVGGEWYVDEHLWLADGDPLVERVLEAG